MKIKIFQAEESIANLIENNSIAFCSKAEMLLVPEGHKIYTTASSKPVDLDLYYPTKSILATTIWNKNDDVFSPKYTWAARHTPVHSPTNIDHDHNKIVGHITDAWVIDANGKLIDDDTAEENLPSKFHLCNGAVIYKYSREPHLMAQAEKLIEEIESGKKFVSMECLFPDFDYAVISSDNNYRIIERNEATAFLTKHLRIYGGSGSYSGHKIGRFLKNMVFSGKGYVDNPANPESIIFGNETEFDFSIASYQNDLFEINDKKIYFGVNLISESSSSINEGDSDEPIMENEIMADINLDVQKLEAQVASLTKQLADADVKAKNEEIESLKAQLAKATTEIEAQKAVAEELKTQVESTKAEVEASKSEIEKLAAAKAELASKIEEAEKNQTRAERIAKLIDGGVAKDVAEAKVEKFAALSSEQFNEVADVIINAVKPTETVEETAADVEAEVEADLSTVEVTEEAVASVGDDDENENVKAKAEVRNSIAKYLGWSSDENNGE